MAIKRKTALITGCDRRWATVATPLRIVKMNDVETSLGGLSYLVAFKTFLRIRPRINNEVSPRVALWLCPWRDWGRQAHQGLARFHLR